MVLMNNRPRHSRAIPADIRITVAEQCNRSSGGNGRYGNVGQCEE